MLTVLLHREFTCQKCKSEFTSLEDLGQHLTSTRHHHSCPFCKNAFPCQHFLRRNLSTKKTRKGSTFQCRRCRKNFSTAAIFKVHMASHATASRPHKCDQCDKSFKNPDKLAKHKRLVHGPKRKLKCPFRNVSDCKKEFKNFASLRIHMVSHSGVKPFKCPQCSKAFTRRPNLNEHMLTHSNDYPIRCSRCNKGFAYARYLKFHQCPMWAQCQDAVNATKLSDNDDSQELDAEDKSDTLDQSEHIKKIGNRSTADIERDLQAITSQLQSQQTHSIVQVAVPISNSDEVTSEQIATANATAIALLDIGQMVEQSQNQERMNNMAQ